MFGLFTVEVGEAVSQSISKQKNKRKKYIQGPQMWDEKMGAVCTLEPGYLVEKWTKEYKKQHTLGPNMLVVSCLLVVVQWVVIIVMPIAVRRYIVSVKLNFE